MLEGRGDRPLNDDIKKRPARDYLGSMSWSPRQALTGKAAILEGDGFLRLTKSWMIFQYA
jgi:hypothetical protein